MHEAHGESAYGDGFARNLLIARVQEKYHKMLFFMIPQIRKLAPYVFGREEEGVFFVGKKSPAKLHAGDDFRRLGGSQTRDLHYILQRGVPELAIIDGKGTACELDGIGALSARAEDDCEQFLIGKLLRPVFLEFFAGTIHFWQILDFHGYLDDTKYLP